MSYTAKPLARLQVVVACTLSAIAALMFNTMPTFVIAAADGLSLNDSQLGALSGMYLGGFALSALVAVFSIRKVSWHTLIRVSSLVSTSSFLLYTMIDTFSLALVLQLVIGLSMGQLFAMVICYFGDSAQTERLFSGKVFSEILLGAIMIYLLSAVIIPCAGFTGVLLMFAALSVLVSFATLVIPARALPRPSVAGTQSAVTSLPGCIALLALTLSFGALAGLYAFVEVIGQDAGLTATQVSTAVSLSLILSLAALLVTARWGDTLGRMRVLVGATLLVLITFYLLNLPQTVAIFFAAMCTLSVGWNIGVPYHMSIVDQFDQSGHLTVAISVALPLGATLGPPLVGILKESGNIDTAYLLLAGVMALTGAVFAFLAQKAERESINE